MAQAIDRDTQEHLVLAYLMNISPKSATLKQIADSIGLDEKVVEQRLAISLENHFAIEKEGRYRFNS